MTGVRTRSLFCGPRGGQRRHCGDLNLKAQSRKQQQSKNQEFAGWSRCSEARNLSVQSRHIVDDFKFVAVDVECAATGAARNNRSPCRIAAVGEDEEELIDVVVRVPGLSDPLTALTGLSSREIQEGMSLDSALAMLRPHLGRGTVIVGQSIQKDIQWLSLVEGADFEGYVDLAEKFSFTRRGKLIKHSLRNTAFGLLDIDMKAEHHCPVEDARISMRLFNRFINVQQGTGVLHKAAMKLKDMKYSGAFDAVPR